MLKQPLAFRMRPTTLDDVLGQSHIIGKNKLINNMIDNNCLCSMIFFGQPGCGKTTLATIIASSLKIKYKMLNAVTCNKKDIEGALFEASLSNENFILIIDEVHRLNKNIQDILLPHLENGSIILIGATTSNPYHSINSAIRSRVQLVEVKPLATEDVITAIKKAIFDERGLNGKYTVTDEAIKLLASYSAGDLRFALNKLEVASFACDEKKYIDEERIKQAIQRANLHADKNDDEHYNIVSAFQKSIRGSDVDAALYYLAKLIASDDLDSIERRLLVIAYEDVGLANPAAVDRTYNAIMSARIVGFPEGAIPLGFAVVDLALSPKSKSTTMGVYNAVDFASKNDFPMPEYLKFTPVGLAKESMYDYDRLDVVEKIQYLPSLIKNMKFYKPNYQSGPYELSLIKNYERLAKINRTSNLKELYKNKSD